MPTHENTPHPAVAERSSYEVSPAQRARYPNELARDSLTRKRPV